MLFMTASVNAGANALVGDNAEIPRDVRDLQAQID
jgi:hypothetical protein